MSSEPERELVRIMSDAFYEINILHPAKLGKLLKITLNSCRW
jgi:hypothetical protein